MKLLGLNVKDRVTGFTGVVASVCFDLYGCVQAVVTPAASKDGGKIEESRWFDTKRLEALSDTPVMDVPHFGELRAVPVAGGFEKSLPSSAR